MTEQLSASHLTQPAAPVTAAAQQPAAAQSHAGQPPSESWLITWEASTDGSGSYEGWRVLRQSRVSARIVVNYYDDGNSEYYANEYTATYLVDRRNDESCSYGGGQYHYHYRTEVIDPTPYDGIGPVTPNTVMPYKPTPWVGTRWTMPMLNLVLGGLETSVRTDITGCGNDEHWYSTSVDTSFTEHLTSDARSPFNSDNGPLFLYDIDTQFEVTEGYVTYPLHLVEHLRVERLAGLDLRVRDIEVTQGLQLHNTIPLVQGRRTVVRAYIDIGTVPGPIAGVTGRLRAYDGTTLLGELEPFNMAGSIFAERAPDWRKVDDTLDFELPWQWTLVPSLSLEVEVNHTRQVSEINYANNTRSVELPFRNCQPITLGYLPIRFAPPGVTPASPDADIARGQEFMRKIYPVADLELFYQPLPGMTWNRPIDGATEAEQEANSERLLKALQYVKVFHSGPKVDRLVGWLPADVSLDLVGMADGMPGLVAWVAQKKDPKNFWRATFAHEVAHTYGLDHTRLTTGGYHWFDVYERAIKPPGYDGNLRDLMYFFAIVEEDRWISPYSFNALFNEFCSGGSSTSSAAQAQAAADLLVVSGNVSVTATQSGQLEPLYRTAGTQLILPAGTSYYVVLKNGTTELGKYGFDAYPANLEVGATEVYTPTIAPFVFAVPYPAGLNRVDLTDRDGKLLSSRVASAHQPTVTVQFPNATGLTLDGVQTIRWAGSDPDGDALTYSVLYSKDNGVTWNAIGADITETSYAVDFTTIPGSSSALIKVLASDGFHTASDVSDQLFTVPSKPPVAVIFSPPTDAHFKVGEQIKLQGYVVDLEEGMVASGSLSWSSDLDGALGTGDAREVTLSEGTHTITLDVSGGAASATTTVVVEVPPPPPERFYTYLPLVLR